MKMALATFAMTIFSSSAFAFPGMTMPDFSMITNYEKSVVAKNADVKAMVKELGASSYRVTMGKPAMDMYAVVTNNGCSFDVQVVYVNWPGIDDVVVFDNAVCTTALSK